MVRNKVQEFRELHDKQDILLLPNAWDAATALIFSKANFKAIGTTSTGIAASLGYKDGEIISFDELVFVARHIINCVDKPVSVDVEAGYSNNVDEICDHLITIARLGAVGVNLEDMGRGPTPGLRTIEFACEILSKAKKRLSQAGLDLFINARTDTYLSKLFSPQEVVAETIKRGRAYIEAGAECIFVPGVTHHEEIRTICQEVNAPINVLARPGVTHAQTLKALGVARLSLGNAVYNYAIANIYACTSIFLEQGDAKCFLETTGPIPVLDIADRRRV